MLIPLNDQSRTIADTARAVLKAESGRVHDPSFVCDDGLWSRISDLGWLGIAVPAPDGGVGASFADLGLVLEEAGRVLAPIPLASQLTAIRTVVSLGDREQRASILPSLLDGSSRVAVALQGHDDGVHATATGPDSYTLAGGTTSVLGVHNAHLALVSARTDLGTGLFLAHIDPTVAVRPRPRLDLRRDIGAFDFNITKATRLSKATSAGAVEEASAVLTIALACESAGATQTCLEMIVAHLNTREQFGLPIGTFQGLKHRCSTLLIESTMATTAARLAAHQIDGSASGLILAASIAKVATSKTLLTAAKECIQMHGGMGFSWELDAHLYLRRAKSDEHLMGTPRAHGARIADLLGVSSSDTDTLEAPQFGNLDSKERYVHAHRH